MSYLDSNELRGFGMKADLSVPTVESYARGWLLELEMTRRRSTLVGYRTAMVEALPVIGHMRITAVTRADALEVAKALAKGGKGSRSPQTVKALLRGLSSMFGTAAEDLLDAGGDRRLQNNPFNNVGKLVERIEMPREDVHEGARRPDPFSDDELELILRAPMSPPERIKVRLGIWAGLRRSEVLGLHWDDLNLEGGRLYVNRRLSRGELGRTKSFTSTREVPLSSALQVELQSYHVWLKRQAMRLGMGAFYPMLFPSSRGYEDETTMGRWFVRLLNEAKVRARYQPFHQLRHTYCSRLLSNGVAPFLVSKWMGHSNSAFTEARYGKWLPRAVDQVELDRALGVET